MSIIAGERLIVSITKGKCEQIFTITPNLSMGPILVLVRIAI